MERHETCDKCGRLRITKDDRLRGPLEGRYEYLCPRCAGEFVRSWEGKGIQRPYCFECVHFAHGMFTARGICWEYGAYVSLYSSCRTFKRRVGSSPPIVDEDQVKMSHRLGLADLVK